VQQTGKKPEELEGLSAGLRAPATKKCTKLYLEGYEDGMRRLKRVSTPVAA
jgi:hypothetical protein